VKKVPTLNVDESRRLRDTARFWKGKKPQDKDRQYVMEVMWLRDLLMPLFQNARIATYSYKSDWRDPDVKTSLRQCAEQFLNVLSQHRQHANVSYLRIYLIVDSIVKACMPIGTPETTCVNRT
jgi:hypothetical protein